MKKILTAIAIIALMSFGIATNVSYKATFSEAELIAMKTHMLRVWYYVDNSNLPHGDVKFVQGQIDSAWGMIQSKLIADSTKKK